MLRTVSSNLKAMPSKLVVDTLYAVGRLHRKPDLELLAKLGYAKFFHKWYEAMLTEVLLRVEHLHSKEIAYLCKGLINSKNLLSLPNRELEVQIREKVLARSL